MSSLATMPNAITPAEESDAVETNRRPRGRRRTPVRYRVVWADDDPNITAAHARRLRRRGVKVLPAADGMQAYWLAVTEKPDLVVTDMRMPRWEGRDLLECLLQNSQTANVPIAVVSGYVTPAEEQRLLDDGVAAVLSKPVEWDRLHRVLRGLLRDA